MVIGYFNWRLDLRGGYVCEKVLKEHVDWWIAGAKGYYEQVYKARLVNSIGLEAEQWKLSLAELSVLYPPSRGTDNADQ